MNKLAHLPVISALLLFLSILLSCSNETDQQINAASYDYDEVLHFTSGEEHSSIPRKSELSYEILTVMETELHEGFMSILPERLRRLKFTEKVIPKKDFDELNSIFENDPLDENVQTECVPTYRDFIIFMKDNEVLKVAQLCFQCEQSHFVGPWPNMISFGQRGEFEELETLLNK